MKLPSWRPLTWVILVINLLFLFWIIGGLNAAGENCAGLVGDELDACEVGTGIGAGIAVTGILIFWVLVDIILGIIWLITGRNRRTCPACGYDVKKGQFVCKKCGHDFRTQTAPV